MGTEGVPKKDFSPQDVRKLHPDIDVLINSVGQAIDVKGMNIAERTVRQPWADDIEKFERMIAEDKKWLAENPDSPNRKSRELLIENEERHLKELRDGMAKIDKNNMYDAERKNG